MSPESKPLSVDLTNCDREPIHIPGAIQPHGVLLVVREPDLVVTQVSESIALHLGRRAEDVVGNALEDIIDSRSAEEVRRALERRRPSESNPIRVSARGMLFDGLIHRHEGAVILELEPVSSRTDDATQIPLRIALGDLQSADTVMSLCETVAQTVRRLTGFERVMLYRFDEDGHGAVEAEAKDEALEPYLGLHYPASDIPRQARALYLRNWLRIIPDARHVPSRIVPSLRPDTDQPLDLSLSVLRSVSPVHLEYLANMGVRASMSIAIVVAGRLWGLVLCVHHTGPKMVDYETRSTCEAIGRLVSLQIPALEEQERAALRSERATLREALSDAMTRAPIDEDVLDSLVAQPDALLALVNAEGVAVVGRGVPRAFGRTPSEPLLREIAEWLAERGQREPFATRSLALLLENVATTKDVASGLLTIALPGTPVRRVLWFLPELVHTVTWGGDPHKAMETDRQTRLHPRRSFEKWKQEVSMRSRPWTMSDLEAVEELRRRAVEIDLDRQLARAQRAVQVRDDLVAVVSHDLKNPLNVIKMQTEALSRSEEGNDERDQPLTAAAARIQRAVDRMNALINDLLDLAKIETGRFELQRGQEYLPDLVSESVAFLRPLAEAKRISVVYEESDSCMAPVDRERIFQVLSNVVGNAIKFTPEGGRIAVESKRVTGELWISVTDTGPGIDEAIMEHVFDRYWQAARSRRGTGSGLGLYIAKGILEAHGGRIWVERAAGGGAKFTFAIPCGEQARDEQSAHQ